MQDVRGKRSEISAFETDLALTMSTHALVTCIVVLGWGSYGVGGLVVVADRGCDGLLLRLWEMVGVKAAGKNPVVDWILCVWRQLSRAGMRYVARHFFLFLSLAAVRPDELYRMRLWILTGKKRES
jgi:hypothetical protein